MKIQKNLKPLFYPAAFALALIFCPIGAMAFDASRIVSDPAYLPMEGQFFGSSTYNYGYTTSNTNNYLGAQTSTNTTTSNTITQLFEFSLTDDFTLRVSDSYQWPSSTTNFANGNTSATNSNGFTDPTFAVIWRLLDQRDHFINWDLIGAYSPNFINAQSATPTQLGTVARGGDTNTFGTAFSQQSKHFTLYLEGTTTFLDNRSVLNPTSQITTNYNSSWQYYLLLATQTRLSDQWSINVSLSHTFNDNVSASYVNNAGNQINYTNQPGDLTTLSGALNLQMIPNRFVLSFLYSHNFYYNGGNTYDAAPQNNTTFNNKDEDIFGGELRYVFN